MSHTFIPNADSPPPDPTHTAAIKQWTSELLQLPLDATVTVSELACRDPGCPLLETVVTVFEPGGTRQWRFTRPRVAVTKLMLQQTFATPPHREG
ncbi:hypothetical protein MASR2M8_05450 [Opitutaceae bacterium]